MLGRLQALETELQPPCDQEEHKYHDTQFVGIQFIRHGFPLFHPVDNSDQYAEGKPELPLP
jgi:hypothetical protein